MSGRHTYVTRCYRNEEESVGKEDTNGKKKSNTGLPLLQVHCFIFRVIQGSSSLEEVRGQDVRAGRDLRTQNVRAKRCLVLSPHLLMRKLEF